ncbi:hypothetical protein HK105_208203 [Polyrhizophydium stewartii]|uniref:Uncharacterized protein n=1 Tax=Polyrhizophydium stewartii TaxID=2732419 RepID=A0ABR4MYI6_9FUNG
MQAEPSRQTSPPPVHASDPDAPGAAELWQTGEQGLHVDDLHSLRLHDLLADHEFHLQLDSLSSQSESDSEPLAADSQPAPQPGLHHGPDGGAGSVGSNPDLGAALGKSVGLLSLASLSLETLMLHESDRAAASHLTPQQVDGRASVSAASEPETLVGIMHARRDSKMPSGPSSPRSATSPESAPGKLPVLEPVPQARRVRPPPIVSSSRIATTQIRGHQAAVPAPPSLALGSDAAARQQQRRIRAAASADDGFAKPAPRTAAQRPVRGASASVALGSASTALPPPPVLRKSSSTSFLRADAPLPGTPQPSRAAAPVNQLRGPTLLRRKSMQLPRLDADPAPPPLATPAVATSPAASTAAAPRKQETMVELRHTVAAQAAVIDELRASIAAAHRKIDELAPRGGLKQNGWRSWESEHGASPDAASATQHEIALRIHALCDEHFTADDLVDALSVCARICFLRSADIN